MNSERFFFIIILIFLFFGSYSIIYGVQSNKAFYSEKCSVFDLEFVRVNQQLFIDDSPILICKNTTHVCDFRIIYEDQGRFLLSSPYCEVL